MSQQRLHHYSIDLDWVGGEGSAIPFRQHDRSYVISAEGKPPIPGSSDPVFRGDGARWNPEDLLVASLSA